MRTSDTSPGIRGRDEAQEEKHEEEKPDEGGHRRRGQKPTDWLGTD